MVIKTTKLKTILRPNLKCNVFQSMFVVAFIGAAIAAFTTMAQPKLQANGNFYGFFDNFFTKSFNIGFVGFTLIITIIIFMSVGLLTSLKWGQAFLISLPSILLLGTLYIVAGISEILPIPTSIYLEFPGYVLTFFEMLLLLYMTLLLSYSSIRFAASKNYKNLKLELIVCLLLSGLCIGAVLIASKIQAEPARDITPKYPNFKVYQPTYTVPGYSPDLRIYNIGGYPSIGQSNPPNNSSYYWNNYEYVYDNTKCYDSQTGGCDNYNLYSYAAQKSYNPPRNCGIDFGNDLVSNCKLIGQSVLGCHIYYLPNVFDSKDGSSEAFCKLGNTIISLYISTYSTAGPNGALIPGQSATSQTQYNQIIDIFNSLKPSSKQQIKNAN